MRAYLSIGRVWVGAAVVLFGMTASTVFGTIVDSHGFEDPPFSISSLEGQDGWLTAGGGVSTATVQTAIVKTGTQAVRVDRGANSDDFWAKLVIGFPVGQFIVIDWDMYVVEATGPQSFGPYFGVSAFDDSGGFGLLGSFGVDAKTGEVLYQFEDNGTLVAPGATVSFDVWNSFRIVLDYGADEYSTFLNGVLQSTTGFVDRGLGLDDFTDANIHGIGAAGTAAAIAATGTAYFDNFSVVPEPASWILLLGGLASMMWMFRWRR